jgi:hypothetical protein
MHFTLEFYNLIVSTQDFDRPGFSVRTMAAFIVI